MRSVQFTFGICLTLAGCQAYGPPREAPLAVVSSQRPPSSTIHGTSAAPEQPPPTGAVYVVQQAQHVELVPTPAPEPIPYGQLRPVSVGALTLADLEQMAMSANPSMAHAAALVQEARGTWVQVGLPFNPSLGYEGQQIGSGGRAEQDGMFVGQEFVRGGKLGLNRQVAAQHWARREQELAAQQQRVLTDVRIAYYQVLIAERQERLTLELRDIAAESVKVAEALRKGMEVGQVDLIQAQLELGNAGILAQNARNRYAAAWRTLATVVGNSNWQPRPLAGEVDEVRPEHNWDTARERLLSTSPEIAAAMTDIERARWALERAYAEKVPNVTVQGLVNWRDEGIDGKPDGALTVGVPLPLWNRNQGGIIQAQGQVAAAERALDQLELSLENRLAPVFERYASALNQVNTYRSQLLPAAQQSLDIARRVYQAGEAPYLNLLVAQRSYSQTNVNYLESLRELRSADAEIEGLLLRNSLESR